MKPPNPNPSSTVDPWDSPKLLLELLMKAEEKIKSLRESVIKETGKLEYTTRHEPVSGFFYSIVTRARNQRLKFSRPRAGAEMERPQRPRKKSENFKKKMLRGAFFEAKKCFERKFFFLF